MRIVAAVMDSEQIARLCEHLGEPAQAPVVQPSRYQVQTQWDFADAPVGTPDTPVGTPTAQPQRELVDAVPPQWDAIDPPAPSD